MYNICTNGATKCGHAARRDASTNRQQLLQGGGGAAGGMLLADLAGLGQPQVYAVCKGREQGSGERRNASP
jgi:hypothetical protein